MLENLPDEASWDDLMYEIYVRKKIDNGIEAADNGQMVSHEEAKSKLDKWLK